MRRLHPEPIARADRCRGRSHRFHVKGCEARAKPRDPEHLERPGEVQHLHLVENEDLDTHCVSQRPKRAPSRSMS